MRTPCPWRSTPRDRSPIAHRLRGLTTLRKRKVMTHPRPIPHRPSIARRSGGGVQTCLLAPRPIPRRPSIASARPCASCFAPPSRDRSPVAHRLRADRGARAREERTDPRDRSPVAHRLRDGVRRAVSMRSSPRDRSPVAHRLRGRRPISPLSSPRHPRPIPRRPSIARACPDSAVISAVCVVACEHPPSSQSLGDGGSIPERLAGDASDWNPALFRGLPTFASGLSATLVAEALASGRSGAPSSITGPVLSAPTGAFFSFLVAVSRVPLHLAPD